TGTSIYRTARAEEGFKKLQDAQIKAKLAGMESTDDVHWTEQYMRNGSYRGFYMGKTVTGKWFVRNGELCIDDGQPVPECKEVWLSGNKVQFLIPGGTLYMEGVVQKQQPRQ